MTVARQFAPGTVLGGKFRVVRMLGEGGMGAVYEIVHELTHHHRALKLLHPSVANTPGVLERFLREASAAGRIGNPHIVETFDAGQLETGEPYIVMEMLQGEPLANALERRNRIPTGELAEIMRQVAATIEAAHHAGIVHRDLKPDNVFLLQIDGRPFVKILDFGISKFAPGIASDGMAQTREGSMLGTPYYMAPEQLHGLKDVDARVDVWAMGVILYECASGQRPFTADSMVQLGMRICEGKPTPLLDLQPDLPPGFVAVLERAMEPEREKRFQTASELQHALEPFADPSMAPPRFPISHPPSAAPSEPTPAQGAMLDSLATAPTALSTSQASIPTNPPPPRAPWKRVLAAALALVALVAVAGLIAFVAFVRPPTSDIVESSADPRVPVVESSPPTTRTADPVATEPTGTASAVASASASMLPPKPATVPPSPTAKRAPPAPTAKQPGPKATPPSGKRADQLGLDTENPIQ
jgi:eukaryotic-like serine/threonine-protein kinase